MSFSIYTDGLLTRTTRPTHLTPKGEDAYYRHHSFTLPRPFAHLRARLAVLQIPKFLHRTSHNTAPALK